MSELIVDEPVSDIDRETEQKLKKLAATLEAVNEKRKIAFSSLSSQSCRECHGKGWYSIKVTGESFATIEPCNCALKNHRVKTMGEMEKAKTQSGPVISEVSK